MQETITTNPAGKAHLAPATRKGGFVPPVFIVNAAMRLRRFFLRLADLVVPGYVGSLDRFFGAANTMLMHMAAHHRIADLLVDGPLSGTEIAARIGCNADVTERMMIALTAIGVFKLRSDGRFANNKISRSLRTGAPGGIRGFADYFGHEEIMRAWAYFPESLKHGRPGFKEVHGHLAWDWLAGDPDAQAAFAEGMSSMTQEVAPAIAAAYPFHEVKTVCDVGGGVGIVLANVLRRHEHLQGMLFDSEAMLGEAHEYLAASGIADRVTLVPGSFFDAVPKGADCYIIKTVLHNWEDPEVYLILQNCRAAMEKGQRLVVSDFLVSKDPFTTLVPYMDITGLMIFNGRERSPERLAAMFAETGFAMRRIWPLPGAQAVFEAVAV